jgi:hypothetical protein
MLTEQFHRLRMTGADQSSAEALYDDLVDHTADLIREDPDLMRECEETARLDTLRLVAEGRVCSKEHPGAVRVKGTYATFYVAPWTEEQVASIRPGLTGGAVHGKAVALVDVEARGWRARGWAADLQNLSDTGFMGLPFATQAKRYARKGLPL